MTDQSVELTQSPLPEPPRRKRSPLARLGCAVALVFWFLLILSPCALILLATRGELSLDLGAAPEQTARVWLLMEDDARGLGLSLPAVQTSTDGAALCVQTDVRYFLWDGQADPTSYCACYRRASAEATWEATTTTEGSCTLSNLEAVDQP